MINVINLYLNRHIGSNKKQNIKFMSICQTILSVNLCLIYKKCKKEREKNTRFVDDIHRRFYSLFK